MGVGNKHWFFKTQATLLILSNDRLKSLRQEKFLLELADELSLK